MKKVIIKDSRNADSRTADEELTEETLRESTETHIREVGECMDLMAGKLHKIGVNHDWTKIKYFDEFAENVLTPHTNEEFISQNWYQDHVSEERHHLNANCPLDVNLFDVLEMIADCVAAGKGRAGKVTPAYIKLKDPFLLERAFWNTVEWLDNHTVLEDDIKHKRD